MHYFVNYFHEPFTSNKDLSDKDILSLCFRFAFQNKESLDFVTENAELSLLYINGEKLQKAAELLVEETVSLKDFHSNMENWNADYSAETDTYTVGYATDYWGGDPYYLVEDESLEITETEDTITVIAKVQYIPQLGTVENIRSLKYCFSKIEENGFVYFHINSISEL